MEAFKHLIIEKAPGPNKTYAEMIYHELWHAQGCKTTTCNESVLKDT